MEEAHCDIVFYTPFQRLSRLNVTSIFFSEVPQLMPTFYFFVLCSNSKKEAFLDISNDDAMLYNTLCVCVCATRIFLYMVSDGRGKGREREDFFLAGAMANITKFI